MNGAGVRLESLTWPEAAQVLTPDTLVVIPLGASLKQHGPHLPLDTDWRIAGYLAAALRDSEPVVTTPTIGLSYYPAFVDYPGSVSLDIATSSNLVTQVCLDIARWGPRRFYVLNTGVSTRKPLDAAAESLRARGILLRFSDIDALGASAVTHVCRQAQGGHADEVETSLMLAIAPESVRMEKACRDGGTGSGIFRRTPGELGLLSPSGVNGDATLADAAKGRIILQAMIVDLRSEIDALRRSGLPVLDNAPGHRLK